MAGKVIGHNNKYNCHKFAPGQPRGLLSLTKSVSAFVVNLVVLFLMCVITSNESHRHRAFSVLLFDSENRLLLGPRNSLPIP